MDGLLNTALVTFLRNLLTLTGYVSNSKTFPKPLSREQEKKYIDLMGSGSEEARNTLIEHNLRLVAHIVKKFDGTGEDPDDLISIGTVGLIKGVSTFDPNKGTRLATYAARCIENEILMHLRATKKNRTEVHLEEPIGVDREGNEITLMDVLQADEDQVDEQVGRSLTLKKIRSLLKSLSQRERKVLEMRYGIINGQRLTQREVATRLGISRSYVSRIEKKAIQKLTSELSE